MTDQRRELPQKVSWLGLRSDLHAKVGGVRRPLE